MRALTAEQVVGWSAQANNLDRMMNKKSKARASEQSESPAAAHGESSSSAQAAAPAVVPAAVQAGSGIMGALRKVSVWRTCVCGRAHAHTQLVGKGETLPAVSAPASNRTCVTHVCAR
jgi:hypothetical protein